MTKRGQNVDSDDSQHNPMIQPLVDAVPTKGIGVGRQLAQSSWESQRHQDNSKKRSTA